MDQFVPLVLRLPLRVFVMNAELSIQIATEMRDATSRWLNDGTGPEASVPFSLTTPNQPYSGHTRANIPNTNFRPTSFHGDPKMHDDYSQGNFDTQLGETDKVKYVDYEIRFKKPDYEALLFEETSFMVNYATNAQTFAGLRLADFRLQLADGLPLPSSWRNGAPSAGSSRNPYGYDDIDNPTSYSSIPQDDDKHILFKITKVDSSTEKKETSQVDAIREVRDAIRELGT